MTLRQYLILMSLGAIICWVAWFFILKEVDPSDAGIIGFSFFYTSLFLALAGTISVIGFAIRKTIVKSDEIVFHHVKRTFRQGLIFSLAIIFSLLLMQLGWLRWWSALVIVFSLTALEVIVFASRKFNNKDQI